MNRKIEALITKIRNNSDSELIKSVADNINASDIDNILKLGILSEFTNFGDTEYNLNDGVIFIDDEYVTMFCDKFSKENADEIITKEFEKLLNFKYSILTNTYEVLYEYSF